MVFFGAPSFYHVMIDTRSGVTLDQTKAQMDYAIDWYKYNATNWLVFSSSPPDVLYKRLEGLVIDPSGKGPNGSLVILKVDMTDYQGWFNKALWEWIKKPRPWGVEDRAG